MDIIQSIFTPNVKRGMTLVNIIHLSIIDKPLCLFENYSAFCCHANELVDLAYVTKGYENLK